MHPTPAPLTFRVPRWCPPSLNAGLGNWRRAYALKKAMTDLLAVYFRGAGGVPVSHLFRPVRKVTLTVIGWAENPGEMPDPDNLLKFFLDSATAARIIVDDHKDWCKWARPVLQVGAPDESIVTVTDLRIRPPCKPEHDPYTRRLLASWKRKINSGTARRRITDPGDRP